MILTINLLGQDPCCEESFLQIREYSSRQLIVAEIQSDVIR
jgi:hypothetical protein